MNLNGEFIFFGLSDNGKPLVGKIHDTANDALARFLM
jgi:hypothetical protein